MEDYKVTAIYPVLCKECKHCTEAINRTFCLDWGYSCDPDGWCYKGERKQDGK